jgi:FemAB family protein
MQIIYRKDNPELWKSVNKDIPNASPFYSSLWIEYLFYYGSNSIKADLSFVILKEDRIIGACPLFLESHNDQLQFSLAGSYIRAPLISCSLGQKEEKKVEQLAYDTIFDLAKSKNVSKYMALIDPLSLRIKDTCFNSLRKWTFLDTSITTQIIPLDSGLQNIHTGIRKSFTSLINNGEKHYEIVIFDKDNPDWSAHEQYRILHHKTSGRVTRHLKTFDLQFEQLKNDEAILIGLKFKGKWIGFSYFNHSNSTAYYSSASDDPDETSLPCPISHVILWNAIKYYCQRGFKWFESGWQHFGEQMFDHPSEKDIQIAAFKRGFGGETFPLWRGIKYFSQEALERDIEQHRKLLLSQFDIK